MKEDWPKLRGEEESGSFTVPDPEGGPAAELTVEVEEHGFAEVPHPNRQRRTLPAAGRDVVKGDKAEMQPRKAPHLTFDNG